MNKIYKYYTLVEVNSSISTDEFKKNISCIQEAFIDRDYLSISITGSMMVFLSHNDSSDEILSTLEEVKSLLKVVVAKGRFSLELLGNERKRFFAPVVSNFSELLRNLNEIDYGMVVKL